MRARTLAIFLVVLLVSSFSAQKPDQRVIEDKDYCFRLTAPSKEWRLLEEAEARKISPDAVAAAMSTTGGFGFVIVEPVMSGELKEMVSLVLDAMPVQDKQLTGPIDVEFQKERALRFQVEGTVEGNALKWDYVLVAHGGFVYQVVCGAPVANAQWGTDRLAPFQAGFSFTAGTPHARHVSSEIVDRTDVGWEVRNQTFRSAVYGIEATPVAPWRLMIGKELRNVLADAHVGFSCTIPEIYVVLIAENLGMAEIEGVKAASFEGLTMGKDSLPVQVLGRELVLRQATSSDAPQFEYLCGVTSEGATVTKVLAWYLRSSADVARPSIKEVLSTTRTMEAKAREELSQRLSSGPDVQNRVGKDWCLRHGVYDDFAAGFRWTKPPGIWRIHAGDEAHEESEGCSLQFEDEEVGITGFIGVSRVVEPNIMEFLQTLSDSVFGEGYLAKTTPRKLMLGDAQAVTLSGPATGEIPSRVDLTVAVTNDRAFHMIVAGTAGQMERAAARVDAARAGMHVFAKPRVAVTESNGVVRDERLGFALSRPAAGWKRTRPPLGGATAQAAAAGWKKEKEDLSVFALCPDFIDPDPRTFVDVVLKLVPTQFTPKASQSAVRDMQNFLGMPRDHMTWKQGSAVVDVYFVVRDRTCYMVCTEAEGHAFDRALAERCLTLIP